MPLIFGICTSCQHIDFLKWDSKLKYQKDIHFKTQPGPVAKNATPKPLAGSLDQRSTDWATEAVAWSMRAYSIYIYIYIQVAMPVKYKGILDIWHLH